MKKVMRIALAAALFTAPTELCAQHGRGGFHGGGFPGGYRGGLPGGYAGRGMGMGRPSTATLPYRPGGVARPYSFSHNAFSNRPAYHGGWYRGDWHGHWAGPWGYRPWGWGWYGGWGWGPSVGFGWGFGLGATSVSIGMASPWNWGYFGYNNPYWAAPVGTVNYVNYSQPVVMAAPAPSLAASGTASAAPAPSVPQSPAQSQGLAIFANAQALFRQGQYQAALNETDRAAALLPNDSLVHEFRALCLFALRDYQQAAAAVHAVVSAGPGWNWSTVSNLYGNPAAYTDQLRTLEAYCNQHPSDAAPRFLLAYHYLLAEHNQEAAAVLDDVVRLQPNDQLASQLLKGLATPADAGPLPAAPSRPAERAKLLGHWRASRADGSSFDLDLTDDNKFRWHFKQQDREQQFAGNFTLANNFLILSASDQNALVGQVSLETDNKLKFRLAGGNPAEPGLTFTR